MANAASVGLREKFVERITLDGFDFFTPQGYDKIYREGKKVLMNLLARRRRSWPN